MRTRPINYYNWWYNWLFSLEEKNITFIQKINFPTHSEYHHKLYEFVNNWWKVNNLIDNSIKYGNNILVNIEKLSSNIIISIDDDGPGIPKAEYNNIIKPFYKIDKSRSESKSSVGLGLAISSDIIKSHGGDIDFDKSKLGGLKVKISLPF